MTEEDDRVRRLIKHTLQPVRVDQPSRELWPLVADRGERRTGRAWPDVVLAAAVLGWLLIFPQSVLLLAYHL